MRAAIARGDQCWRDGLRPVRGECRSSTTTRCMSAHLTKFRRKANQECFLEGSGLSRPDIMGRHTFGFAQCRLRSSSNLIAGGTNRYRYRVRPPSFINLGVLEDLCLSHTVADVMVILVSVDIVMGGWMTRSLKPLQELQMLQRNGDWVRGVFCNDVT